MEAYSLLDLPILSKEVHFRSWLKPDEGLQVAFRSLILTLKYEEALFDLKSKESFFPRETLDDEIHLFL